MMSDDVCPTADDDDVETPWGSLPVAGIEKMVVAARHAWFKGEKQNVMPLEVRDVHEFFGENASRKTEVHNVDDHIGLLHLYALDHVLARDYEVLETKAYRDDESLKPPEYAQVEIARGENVAVMIDGARFVVNKATGEHFIIFVAEGWNASIDIRVVALDSTDVSAVWASAMQWFVTEGPLKGEVFDANGHFLKFAEVSFGDVILCPEQKDAVILNSLGFIDSMMAFEGRGLPTSRGILLSGPPGTGKTMLTQALMNEREGATVLYITSETIDGPGHLSRIYHLARKFTPCILIIEDIDTLGGLDRRMQANHPLLGELLNQLSGAEPNHGVVTVATSNYVFNLDEALRDRPGRFDVIFELGEPALEQRVALLESNLARIGVTVDFDLARIARVCMGFTGAWMRELVVESMLLASQEMDISNREMTLPLELVEKAHANILARRGIAAEQEPKHRKPRNGLASAPASLYN